MREGAGGGRGRHVCLPGDRRKSQLRCRAPHLSPVFMSVVVSSFQHPNSGLQPKGSCHAPFPAVIRPYHESSPCLSPLPAYCPSSPPGGIWPTLLSPSTSEQHPPGEAGYGTIWRHKVGSYSEQMVAGFQRLSSPVGCCINCHFPFPLLPK